MATTKPPMGFLCYVWKDDEHDRGGIGRLRTLLGGEIGARIGEDFQIFQDRTDLKWGEVWRERIERSLDSVTFLFPVLTPRFFRSAECRRELGRFLDRERELGSPGLVMPIYWITHPPLEGRLGTGAGDRLVSALAERQLADWRRLRLEPPDSAAVRLAVAGWAEQVAAVVHRAVLDAPDRETHQTDASDPDGPDADGHHPEGPDTGGPGGTAEGEPAGLSEGVEAPPPAGERSARGKGKGGAAPSVPDVGAGARPGRGLPEDVDAGGRDYFEFVTRHFVDFIYDRSPYLREDFSSDVLLHEPAPDELRGDGRLITECGYLRWQRVMNYYLRALRDDCPDAIVTQTSNVVEPAMLSRALRYTRFGIEVRAGNQRGASLVNWDLGWVLKADEAERNADFLREHGRIEGESTSRGRKLVYSVAYELEESGEPVLDLRIRLPWLLGREWVWVRGWEDQLLRRDENFYHLNIRHPTRGIRAQMRLGHGLEAWSLLEPTLAPDKYPKEPVTDSPPAAESGDEPVARPDPHYRNVTLPSWVLPGIALLLEWRYPMTDRLFAGAPRLPDAP